MKKYILLVAIFSILTSCWYSGLEEKKVEEKDTENEGVAKEVLQTTNYTYILLDNNGKETWIAGPKTDARVGVKYTFEKNMIMENFQSKELNRYFDEIVFAQKISDGTDSFQSRSEDLSDYKTEVVVSKQDINISRVKGTSSIAEIFANKAKYKGTQLIVRGVVTKYNAGIMGKNWLHIQDGTENSGHFDLVVTSQENAKIGDTLTLSGTISLDQDFGYGYKYDVLLEKAVIK
jgi:hypothetical protein